LSEMCHAKRRTQADLDANHGPIGAFCAVLPLLWSQPEPGSSSSHRSIALSAKTPQRPRAWWTGYFGKRDLKALHGRRVLIGIIRLLLLCPCGENLVVLDVDPGVYNAWQRHCGNCQCQVYSKLATRIQSPSGASRTSNRRAPAEKRYVLPSRQRYRANYPTPGSFNRFSTLSKYKQTMIRYS